MHLIQFTHAGKQHLVVLISHSAVINQELRNEFGVEVKCLHECFHMALRQEVVLEYKLLVYNFGK